MVVWTGIARRLIVGFGLLVALLGIASAVALAGIDQVRSSMHEMRRLEDGMRTLLLLSTAVRDQYAHQAHMILLGDDSHMDMYESSSAWVHDLTGDILPWIDDEQSRGYLWEIETSSKRIDDLFRAHILPAILAGDRAGAEAVHDEALAIVLETQLLSDRVAERMRVSIAGVESEAAQAHRRSYLTALFMLAGATAFAAAMGLWIGRSVARPVAQLHDGAARLAAGDLTTRIEVDSKDELGRLAERFNVMTESLAHHQAERARAERLAGIGRLAAGVAHEINNPLAVILGYTRLLQRRSEQAGDGASRICSDLAVIEEETERCKAIVNDLLHIARPMPPSPEPVDLRELCDQAADRLAGAAPGETADVTVEGEALAAGSGRALYQVAVNLLRNAMEAAGASGHATVTLSEEDGRALMRVVDDGPGLSAEARERLFEPFHTMKAGGTGLGLAVSRAIVEAHGGSLEADDAPEGGARFVAMLPLHSAADRADTGGAAAPSAGSGS